MKRVRPPLHLALILCAAPLLVRAQAPIAPAWAEPGSATHTQVPPPANFHRPTLTVDSPIGIFAGQSDVGGALVAGSARYDPAKGQYTINSAGYNIWYTRDEFRYLWKRVSGDVSLAADVTFPNEKGYGDRKAVLVFRQDLDDDSKEVMAGLHGAGLIHLARGPRRARTSRKRTGSRAGALPQPPPPGPSASASKGTATPSRFMSAWTAGPCTRPARPSTCPSTVPSTSESGFAPTFRSPWIRPSFPTSSSRIRRGRFARNGAARRGCQSRPGSGPSAATGKGALHKGLPCAGIALIQPRGRSPRVLALQPPPSP